MNSPACSNNRDSGLHRFCYALGFCDDGPVPPDNEFSRQVSAVDAQQAAEEAAEESGWRDCEYPAEQAIFLRDMETGELSVFTVFMETIPVYRAVRVHRDDCNGGSTE